MKRLLQAGFITLIASVAVLCAQLRAPLPSTSGLQHFYVFTQSISDASPFWFDYILDVKPNGRGATVQLIRIAPLNAYCTRPVTVKAVEQVVPASSVASIAQMPLCSLKERDVKLAIRAAKPQFLQGIFEAASHTIVATCGNEERVFDLPYQQNLDFDRLQKNSPSVAALWNLYPDVIHRAFGKDFSFYGVSSSQDADFQELGSRLVPNIRAGLYDEIFRADSLLSSMLREDYIGTVKEQEPEVVELGDTPPVRFRRYVAPTFPPLARAARTQGDVRLNLVLDAQTGSVKNVVAISGHPLLQKAAIDAARYWQFEHDAQSPDSFETTVKFELRCPTH